MLIVLLVISVLMILIVPNLADRNEEVQTQGCNALLKLAESQVQTYILDHGTAPNTLSDLQGDYLTATTCQGGTKTLAISAGGIVTLEDLPG